MSSSKLKNAPLKEVIFELHWESDIDNTGMLHDLGFDLAQGKFAEKLKQKFPIHKKLIPDNVNLTVFGGPIHQYWKGEFEWPVIQHGPGMIAVNQVEADYEWIHGYKPLVENTIMELISSYVKQLPFNRVKLQYIDAWDLNGNDPVTFMSDNLQTEIKNKYSLPGKLKSVNLQQNFELVDNSTLILTIANGLNNKTLQPSMIWTTTVEKQGKLTQEEVLNWLENAHSSASKMFKKMLNPEFYASLDK